MDVTAAASAPERTGGREAEVPVPGPAPHPDPRQTARQTARQAARPVAWGARPVAWGVRLAAPAFVLALTAGVSLRDPHVHGSWGICPTFGMFGVFCPGCGSLRALYDLAHGHLAQAVGHNALVIPAILFMLWSTVRTPGPGWSRIWLVTIVAFTVVRNLPGSPLAP